MITVDLEQIGYIKSACGRTTTYLFAVPPHVSTLTFSRFSDSIICCLFRKSRQAVEVTLLAGEREDFFVDFEASFVPDVFGEVSGSTMLGTFIGAWDDNRETDLPHIVKKVDYAEITKQISTGSMS
jgi:hypothetical protein